MTELLIVELCRIIWNFDEFRRKEELSPEMRETAEWAVSVGKALESGKTLPSGLPIAPWAPRTDRPSYFRGEQIELAREAVLEGNLV